MLLALTVVGRVALTPADPLDARMAAPSTPTNAARAAGRLLGPDAVAAAVERAPRTGAEVLVRPSPWRLDAAHADLTAEWLDGWVAAACEQEPALAAEAGAYRDRRLAQAAAGSSPSPSTTPTCWCCRDRRRPPRAAREPPGRVAVGPPGTSPPRRSRPGLAPGDRPVLDGLRTVDGRTLRPGSASAS
jgi:hypothetical protein